MVLPEARIVDENGKPLEDLRAYCPYAIGLGIVKEQGTIGAYTMPRNHIMADVIVDFDISQIVFGDWQNMNKESYLFENYADKYSRTFDLDLLMSYKSIGYYDPGYTSVFYFPEEDADFSFVITLLTEQDPPCREQRIRDSDVVVRIVDFPNYPDRPENV